MTALTAFELLIKCERARAATCASNEWGVGQKNEALDAVRKELSRCIVEMLTPSTGNKT